MAAVMKKKHTAVTPATAMWMRWGILKQSVRAHKQRKCSGQPGAMDRVTHLVKHEVAGACSNL